MFCAIAPQLVTSVLAWTIKNDCLPAAVGPKKILTGLDDLMQSLDTPMYGIEPYRLLQHLFTQNNINREKLVSWQGRQSCSYCDLTFCNPPIPPSSTDFYLSIYTRVLKVCQLKQLAELVSQSVRSTRGLTESSCSYRNSSSIKHIESNIRWIGLERQWALRLIALCVTADDSESIEIGGINERWRSNTAIVRSSLTFQASAPRVLSPSMGLP